MPVPSPPMTEALTHSSTPVRAGKAVRGDERDFRAAPAGLGTFGIGHALDREGGLLGGARPFDQYLGSGLLRVEHVEGGPLAGDLAGLGEAAIGVLGHRLGHGHRALDEFVERLCRAIARRHDRLLPADQDPQPEIVALGAFELLGLAEPAAMRQGGALEQHRIGGLGAGALRPTDQVVQQID